MILCVIILIPLMTSGWNMIVHVKASDIHIQNF